MPQMSPLNWVSIILSLTIAIFAINCMLPTFSTKTPKTLKTSKKYKTLPW